MRRLQNEKAHRLPPGYVEMTEDEKEEVLKTLRASILASRILILFPTFRLLSIPNCLFLIYFYKTDKALLEKKLRALPLMWDTPSQIKTRSNMDLELQDIENAIKRFSRPHVYMSLND